MSEDVQMQKRILLLATSAFILTYGRRCHCERSAETDDEAGPSSAAGALATKTPRGPAEDDWEITGWGPGWGRGDMRFGMMRGGSMGPGNGMIMRMLFAMMDSDGDGTISLQEFQAAHERIFKAMDANKDAGGDNGLHAGNRNARSPTRAVISGIGRALSCYFVDHNHM